MDTELRAGPSPLAHQIRERVRAKHATCSPAHCPFKNLHAEDIQAVLDMTEEDSG